MIENGLQNAFVYFVRIDFSSRKNVIMDWLIALATCAFGFFAWIEWTWSLWWPAGGVFAVVLAAVSPLGRMQRKFKGMIKRPSN